MLAYGTNICQGIFPMQSRRMGSSCWNRLRSSFAGWLFRASRAVCRSRCRIGPSCCYQDEDLWKHRLAVTNDRRAYVLPLGPDCDIRWINSGAFTDADYAHLKNEISVLLQSHPQSGMQVSSCQRLYTYAESPELSALKAPIQTIFLRLLMEDMHGNIGPEFTEGIGCRIAQEVVGIFAGDAARSVVLAGIVGDGYALCDAASQQFGCVNGIVPMIIRSDGYPADGIKGPLPDGTSAQGVVTLVLMKHSRQRKDHPVVAAGLIDEPAP